MSAVWRTWTSRRAAWALHILFRGDGEAAGGYYNGINIAEESELIDESKTADGRCSCRPPRTREARVGDYGRAAGIAGRGWGRRETKRTTAVRLSCPGLPSHPHPPPGPLILPGLRRGPVLRLSPTLRQGTVSPFV